MVSRKLHPSTHIVSKPQSQRDIVYIPIGTRLMRVVRAGDGWQLWIATADYEYGTYLLLRADGSVLNITARRDAGDDAFVVRPADKDQ